MARFEALALKLDARLIIIVQVAIVRSLLLFLINMMISLKVRESMGSSVVVVCICSDAI